MNLVKKLPIGLSFACVMFLSSCSKESVQVPEPQAGEVNKSATLRSPNSNLISDPDFLNALPVFPSTSNSAGLNTFPAFWKSGAGNPNPVAYPSGTSTLWELWGDQSMPWQLALPSFPSEPSKHCIVTVTSAETGGGTVHKGSRAETKIKNLIVGKKYTIKFWVGTTKRGVGTAYAKSAAIYLGRLGYGPTSIYYVDLVGSKGTWVEKVITFTANNTEMDFSIAGFNSTSGVLSYVNLFVGQKAIAQVN